MTLRLAVLALFSLLLLGPECGMGTILPPPPLPNLSLYERIRAIPATELNSVEMAAASSDVCALTTIYFRCARLALENAGACPWLTFNEQSDRGVSVDGALQAIILGARQGALPTHTELFARYGGSAALADMLLFERPLHPDYASLIAASDGERALRVIFYEGGLQTYRRLVGGEPSSGMDAVLKYLFHDFVVSGSTLPLIRIIELGPLYVERFNAMHGLGLFGGETQYLPHPCAHPASREHRALVALLSFTGHAGLSAVRDGAWPGLSPECRRDNNQFAEHVQRYGVRFLSVVSLAVGDNHAYRIHLHGGPSLDTVE